MLELGINLEYKSRTSKEIAEASIGAIKDIELVDKENMNQEYEFYLDGELELKDQLMLPETKAILFNLFRDYLSTQEQKEKIVKM